MSISSATLNLNDPLAATQSTSATTSLASILSSSSDDTTTDSTTATSSSKVDLSNPAKLMKKLQQLQASDPEKFKQVMTDIAAKLKDAATQAGDTKQGEFLSKLSDKFSSAAQSGDLSELKPPAPPSGNSAQSAYANDAQGDGLLKQLSGGHKGHHHSGGAPSSTDQSQMKTLFDSINQEVDDALSGTTSTTSAAS